MKRSIVIIVISLLFSWISHADDTGTATVAISADQVRADSGALAGHRYVSMGQPDEAVLAAASEAGFVAVVDLRTAAEERGFDEPAAGEALGMEYHSLEIAGAKGVTFDNARALDEILAGIDGPVLLHCQSGNRVGALTALRASMQGASDEAALAIGRGAGMTRLEAAVTERLAED
jgi:uncharacterized protein (TIGR01244 family)